MNNLGDADKSIEQNKIVDVIASGYEWLCPTCGELNKEIEYLEIYTCLCGLSFETSLPEHAYG